MANYANQKIIYFEDKEIIFYSKEKGSRPFLKAVYWEYLEAASRHLKGEAFKVYLYFLSWYGQDSVEYSPTDVSNRWGIGVSTAREALNTLEHMGYIKHLEKH